MDSPTMSVPNPTSNTNPTPSEAGRPGDGTPPNSPPAHTLTQANLLYHEVASLFPLMEGEEFEKLKADMRAHGQRDAIWTFRGQIIDGRNRYRACQALGIEPATREWNGVGSLVEFVVS